MRRSTKFLIGLAAAALTYGSLMAFVGPRHFGHHGFYRYHAYRGDRPAHCDGAEGRHWHHSGETPGDPGAGQSDSSKQNQ